MGQCDAGNKAETKSMMSGSNTNFINNNYSDITSNFSLTSTLNTSHINNIFNEPRWFPKGEQYYKIIKDSNKTNLLENKNDWQSEKVELFFSLLNLVKPKQLYSLSVTIINNNRLGTDNYLGDLDPSYGENLYFGNSFEIDYFYERQQKIIVRPIINNIRLNPEYSFILGDVMNKQNKTHEVTEPKFGTLKINALSLKNYKNNKDLSQIFSNFKFNITLVNINTLVTPNLFFVINHFKDGEKLRPVYKSSEYNTNKITSNLIKIESDFLCKDMNDKIYIEIYSYQNSPVLLATGYFTLSQLQSNSQRNRLTEVTLYGYNKENKGLVTIQYYIKKKTSYIEK